MKIKTFDAVIESRKWKKTVANKTSKLGTEEVLDYFERKAVDERFHAALKHARAKNKP